MSTRERSFRQYGRYPVFRQQKAAALSRSLLVVAVLVLCGTFLVLHLLSRRYNRSALRSDFSSKERSRSEFQESGPCRAVCYTNECLRTAANILQMLDPAIDPCEDFYRYACGGYSAVATEHREREIYSWVVEDEAVKLFRDLIKQIPKSVPEGTPGSSLTKIRKFYDSCVDTVTSEETAVPTALKYLEHFGIKQWPNLRSDFMFTDPDLDEVLIRLALYKQHPFFDVRPRLFPLRNETGSAVPFDFSPYHEVKIQVWYYGDSTIHEKRIAEEGKIVKQILEYFVPNNTDRDDILADVLSFDLALYNLTERTSEKEERCQGNSTSECSSDLIYECSQEGNQQMERWCKLAEKILDRSGFLKKNSRMAVLIEDKEHFQELGLLIDSTNQRTIAHTLAIQFLATNAFFLNSALRRKVRFPEEHAREIPVKYMHEMPETGRSEFCTVWASYRMPILAETAFFASKYNNSKLRKEVNEIYSDIKEISLSTVRENSWIDSKAKEAVEKKYSEIFFMPERRLLYIRDLRKVDDLYKEVVITEKSFLANELETRKLAALFFLKNMDSMTKVYDYLTMPFKFHPQYDDPPNSIYFELGNLHFPSVASNRPRYINLGYFGVVVGHELSHPVEIEIFETFYENKSEVFENALNEKKECFTDHYSQYEIYSSGHKIKGNITFVENLPDYLGIRVAFKSLKKYQEKHGFSEMLPGLHFSPEQMFFIAAAQNWCETHTSKGLEYYVRDFHSTPNARPLGVYRNLDSFSEAFNCPSGCPMNPINKCRFE